jgi:hypothetical protein
MNTDSQVAGQMFTFVRVGHGERRLELLAEGKVGEGSSAEEAFWELQGDNGKRQIRLYNEIKKLSGSLRLCTDGIWRGRSVENARVEIRLVPAKARVLVIQQGDSRCGEMLELTVKRHMAYARKHNMEFWCQMGRVQSERPPVWDKIILLQQALRKNYNLVVWIDADAMIVNLNVDLREALSEFSHVGLCRYEGKWRDRGWHHNAGVIFVRNGPLAGKFFDEVWNSGPSDHVWQEQDRIMDLAEKHPGVLQTIDSRWNAHPSSKSDRPVIKGWHGFPGNKSVLIKKELRELRDVERHSLVECE